MRSRSFMLRPFVIPLALAMGVAVGGLGESLPTMAQPAQSQPAPTKLDDILAKGTLRVGTTGDYRPFSYLNKETGKFEGLDIDLADNLGKAMGVKVEFVQTSWPTMMKDFQADAFDMVVGGVSITLDRAKKGTFTIPMMREGKTPIARCTDKDKFQTLADIDKAGVRVITNPGGTNEKFARANLKTASIAVHNDNVTIFKEIVAGNADLMMTDASETVYQQKLNPALCAIHPDKPFDFAEKAYWLQRDVAFKDFVDQWFHLIRENGQYQSIYGKWFS